MIGMEDVIQRHGIKRALQKTKVAVSRISTEDTDGFGYYDLASEDGRKKKTNAALKRNLKRAMSNQEFRDNDPCNCGGSDWYTFDDENCYNELDEVVVLGVDKSKRQHKLNTNLVKKDHWWNKSIDVSFKNPWPEYRWSYFEDRVSGYYIGGNVNSSVNFGNKIGNNSKIYGSIDTSDMSFMPGGGGTMKFWAHKANYLKHVLRATQDTKTAYDHGSGIRDGYDKLFPEVVNDTVINFSTYKPTSTYKDPVDGKVKAVYSDLIERDTTIDKNNLKNFEKFLEKKKIRHQKEVDDILNGKKSVD